MGNTGDEVISNARQGYDDLNHGKVRWTGLGRKPLEPGETVSAIVRGAAVRPVSPIAAEQDLNRWPYPVHKSHPPTTEGLVVATSQRLLLVGNGHKVKEEWSWQSIESITMGQGAQWLTFKVKGDEDHVNALLIIRRSLIAGPNPSMVSENLLSIEGSWFKWKGELDIWMESLPMRIDSMPSSNLRDSTRDTLLGWASQFEKGELSDPFATRGERFAVRIPAAVAADISIRPDVAVAERVFARGDAIATDSRLVIVVGAETQFVWDWKLDVDGATALRDGFGVALLPTSSRQQEGRGITGVVFESASRGISRGQWQKPGTS